MGLIAYPLVAESEPQCLSDGRPLFIMTPSGSFQWLLSQGL